MGLCTFRREVLLFVTIILFKMVEETPAQAAAPVVAEVAAVKGKRTPEQKIAFKARKNLKKKLAKEELERRIAKTPEAVAERKRKRQEAKDQKAKLHRKANFHKKKYYEFIKAHPEAKTAKKYLGKNPKYTAEAKAKNERARQFKLTQRKKLEELAGMKFI